MSSFSFTHTILLMIFLSSSGIRFVLTFELHDSSLNGFLDTAISQVLQLLALPADPSCTFLRRDPSVAPCRGVSSSLPPVSCTDYLGHRCSSPNLHPTLHTPRKIFLLQHLLPLWATPRTLVLVQGVQPPP